MEFLHVNVMLPSIKIKSLPYNRTSRSVKQTQHPPTSRAFRQVLLVYCQNESKNKIYSKAREVFDLSPQRISWEWASYSVTKSFYKKNASYAHSFKKTIFFQNTVDSPQGNQKLFIVIMECSSCKELFKRVSLRNFHDINTFAWVKNKAAQVMESFDLWRVYCIINIAPNFYYQSAFNPIDKIFFIKKI